MGFSDFGLIGQGSDQYTQVQQGLRATDLQNQEREQGVQEGAVKLNEIKRQESNQQAYRDTASSSQAAGHTLGGSLMEMAKTAAARGDMDSAARYKQGYDSMNSAGAARFVHAIMTNPTPGDRPDLVDLMNSNEATKGVASVSLDDKGNYTVTKHGGQVMPAQNVGHVAELMGLIAQPKLEVTPAGGVGTLVGPGRDPTDPKNQIHAPKTFRENPKDDYITTTSKDADGNEVQHIWDMRPTLPDGTPNPDFKKEVTGASASGSKGPSVRKDLPVLNDINKGILEMGTEYGTTDMTDPMHPIVKFTAKGQQTALIAEQIRMANQNLPPRTIINMAVEGKPMWKNVKGQPVGAVILYHGHEFPMSTPQGPDAAPDQTPAPAQQPQPQQTPAKPQPAKPPMTPAAPPPADTQIAPEAAAPPIIPPLPPEVPGLEPGPTKPGMRSIAPTVPEEQPQRVPIVSAGLDMVSAGKRILGGTGNTVHDLLARGATYEADDPALQASGRLLRSLIKSQDVKRNPNILNGEIRDYETRLKYLEKQRQ